MPPLPPPPELPPLVRTQCPPEAPSPATAQAPQQQAPVPKLRLQSRSAGKRAFAFAFPPQQPAVRIAQTQVPTPEESPIRAIEVRADRVNYDRQQRSVTAEGEVVARFIQGELTADRVRVDLAERVAVASGQVALQRGRQRLRGERFEYRFAQDSGTITNARGEIYIPTLSRDTRQTLPNDASTSGFARQPLGDRLAAQGPQQVRPEGGARVELGAGEGRDLERAERQPAAEGGINQLRFRAKRLEFDGQNWQAQNIRITNDLFSPPELEVAADAAQLTHLGPSRDKVRAQDPRLVFDRTLSLPILRNQVILAERASDPALVNVGFDSDERGGLYLERSFELIQTPKLQLELTPQYFLQRAAFDSSPLGLATLGLKADLEAQLAPRTRLNASGEIVGFNLGEQAPNATEAEEAEDNFERQLQGRVRLRQLVGDRERPHVLNLEYSHNERVFNGSLGFETVRNSLGAYVTSPTLTLGDTGIRLSYQAGVQRITAQSDRPALLEAGKTQDLATLTRYQGAASLSRNFTLWEGEALPRSEDQGLRYTPVPVVPYLELTTGLTGAFSGYSNGDAQRSLSGSIGVRGQIGHFSQPVLDYTGFNLRYTQALRDGTSPFQFDRVVDRQVLELGITQQIYGPVRVGVQTAFDLADGDTISTDYVLEYSRRTYNVALRYNPELGLGAIRFRVHGFNWEGSAEPFSESSVREVRQGVTRD